MSGWQGRRQPLWAPKKIMEAEGLDGATKSPLGPLSATAGLLGALKDLAPRALNAKTWSGSDVPQKA